MKLVNDGRFDYKVSVIKKKDIVYYDKVKTNPAVIDIFNRLKKLDIEEPLRFELKDKICAQRLAQTLNGYRMTHHVPVKVATSNNVVYAYRIA
jgi:hypothetical protein